MTSDFDLLNRREYISNERYEKMQMRLSMTLFGLKAMRALAQRQEVRRPFSRRPVSLNLLAPIAILTQESLRSQDERQTQDATTLIPSAVLLPK